MPRNRQIVLAKRPVGEPVPDDFKFVESDVPSVPKAGVLLRTLYLSLDPYMRGRMSDAPSYAAPTAIGAVMPGGTVSEVVASTHQGYKSGDIVLGYGGWQGYAESDGSGLRKLDPRLAPISTALGVLGMPGMTAYTGLLNIGKPKPGETLVVAAASGAVGSAVGQMAKLKGCRVVGIAGGEDKVRYIIKGLGFDAGIDHRAPDFTERLRAACPAGIDIYFENVGGAVWETVFPLLNFFARIPVCGLIARYNDASLPEGPDQTPLLMRTILTKRLTLRGFIVTDFADQTDAFLRDASAWVKDGKLKYREDIVEGLENAPAAFIGLLRGKNFGKLLIKVAEPSSTNKTAS
jgi:NADPH-dependent curcumin reductase